MWCKKQVLCSFFWYKKRKKNNWWRTHIHQCMSAKALEEEQIFLFLRRARNPFGQNMGKDGKSGWESYEPYQGTGAAYYIGENCCDLFCRNFGESLKIVKSQSKIRENSKAGTVEFIQDIFGTAIQEWHGKRKGRWFLLLLIFIINRLNNWTFFLELVDGYS